MPQVKYQSTWRKSFNESHFALQTVIEFVFGPDDEYASITEKPSTLVVVLKQDFDSASYSPIAYSLLCLRWFRSVILVAKRALVEPLHQQTLNLHFCEHLKSSFYFWLYLQIPGYNLLETRFSILLSKPLYWKSSEVVSGFVAGDSTWPGHNPALNCTVLRSIFQGI